MSTLHTRLAIVLLVCMPLLSACNRQQDAATSGQAPTSALGNMVKMATDEARSKLETENISISGDMHFEVNGASIGRSRDKTKAEITPQGDLLISDKVVQVTPEQRALLLQYRQNIIGIAGAGMDIGVQGADLGMKAATEAINGIFNGNADQVEQRIKPHADRIEAAALELCNLLPPLLETQQKLSATLPAFKPYATMTQEDVSDCKKKHATNDDAVRAEIREGIREEIREDIRSTVRASVRGDAPAGDTPGGEQETAATH